MEKATKTFIKNLGTIHHPTHSTKVIIRAAEAILDVAEHDEGVGYLAEFGALPAIIDLNTYSEDIVILKNCAGLLLAMVRPEGPVGKANIAKLMETGGIETLVALGNRTFGLPPYNKGDPVIKQRCLRALAIIVRDTATHLGMVDKGVVAMLAKLTHNVSERAEILELAVEVMGALCFTHETAEQVATLGGVASLVGLLQSKISTRKLVETTFVALVGLTNSGLETVRYKAAGALRDLAVKDSYKIEIARFKGIEALVKLIEDARDPNTAAQAAGGLRTMILNGFNRLVALREGAVEVLAERMKSNHVQLQTQVVGAMWNLSCEPKCIARMVKAAFVPRLLELASSRVPEVRELAVGLVRSLSVADQATRLQVVELSKHAILHQDTTLDCDTGGRFLEVEMLSWNAEEEPAD